MIETPKILLLGGGYTLAMVSKKLPARSFVITLRDAKKRAEFEAAGQLTTDIDLQSKESLSSILSNWPTIDTVVDSVPPIRSSADSLSGAKVIKEVLEKSGLKSFIYLSTTGVYGVTDGSWVDETTPTRPTQQFGFERLAAENIYRGIAGVSVSIFRIPAIYGPGRGLEQVLGKPHYKLIDGGEKWTNRIHVEDLSGIIAEGALSKVKLPQLVCVSDDSPVLQREIVEAYCKKLDIPPPSSISSEEAREQNLFTMLSNQRVSNALMKATFTWSLKYPSYKEHLKTLSPTT